MHGTASIQLFLYNLREGITALFGLGGFYYFFFIFIRKRMIIN